MSGPDHPGAAGAPEVAPGGAAIEPDAARAQALDVIHRFRRWLAWGVALGALLYIGGSIWADAGTVGHALARFRWSLYVPVLLLTLVNYGLRFWKWHYLLGRLGVRVPVAENAVIFISGLAMVISPAKAGEVLKPYLVRERTGVTMAHTFPALVTERLTDGLACVLLAAVSVGTYAADQVWVVWLLGILGFGGIAVAMSERVSLAILDVLVRLPALGKVGAKLREMYVAMRLCVAPLPLLLTIAASVVAWGAECVGYKLIFEGFGYDVPLDLATFLYAFATVAGGFMPGGLGVADGALGGGALRLVPGLAEGDSWAAAMLIRGATLWFGVFIGAFAMIRVSRMLEPGRPAR